MQADLHNRFRTEGYEVLGMAPRDVVTEIAGSISHVRSDHIDVFYYPIHHILGNAHLKAIAHSEAAILTAAMHLGAKPKILDVSMWRSNVPPEGQVDGAQKWHRDTDDWRACKLFMYLTDVGPDNGPHQFVPGSHRAEFFEVRGMVPDRYFYDAGRSPGVAEVVEGLPRVEMQGPAGMMFMANTFAFHRGKIPTKGHRIVFQVMYGLMDLEKMVQGTNIPAIRKAWS